MSLKVESIEEDPYGHLLLVDGDLLLYTVGFATDHAVYSINGKKFRYKKEAVEYCEYHSRFLSKLDSKELKKEREVEPLPNAIHSLQKLIGHLGERCESNTFFICFSGEKNFRKEMKTDPPYKGNREDQEKPFHYYDLKQWLKDNFECCSVNYLEADDLMGIMQNRGTIICSFDKDMKMIPGNHYNWRTDKKFFVDKDTADRWFWIQMLVGDTADNIQGIYRVGQKTAEKILKEGRGNSEWKMLVEEQYEKAYTREEAERLFQQNADLLWIKRSFKSRWVDLI